MKTESPDTIHGRMKEGAHIAGYSLERTMSNMKWLLEESRFEKLTAGYKDVNEFLRDTKKAFKLLRIDPEERKQIAQLVKDLQPKASQRAIADMVGVSDKTIGQDLGAEYSAKKHEKQEEIAEYSAPPWTTENFDPTIKGKEISRKTRRRKEIEVARLASEELVLPANFEFIHGDFREHPLKDIDVIITDPPYPKEYLSLYEDLAIYAAEALKPGGSAIVMAGQSYLPTVYEYMSKHLNYHWTLCYLTPLAHLRMFARKVYVGWKPCLWMVNGEYEGDWKYDVTNSKYEEKEHHEWQQGIVGMTDLVEKFSDPGDLILDPFMGSGTTGLVAKILGNRSFIGIDVDESCIADARIRIGDAKSKKTEVV